jgi:hypothetical protein
MLMQTSNQYNNNIPQSQNNLHSGGGCQPINSRQFIYTCPDKVFLDHTLSVNELRIYMIVRSFLDSTGEAFPSNEWLALNLDISERTASRCIGKLVTKGHLFVVTVTKNKKDTRYLHVINPNQPGQMLLDPPTGSESEASAGGHNCPGGGGHECLGGVDTSVYLLDQSIINKKNNNKKKEKSTTITNREYRETQFPMPEKGQQPSKAGLTVTDLSVANKHNIPPEMIKDWLEIRSDKRKPVTKTAWNRINTQLSKCSNPIEAFEIMVSRGWVSLQSEWIDKIEGKKGHFDYDDTSWADADKGSFLE